MERRFGEAKFCHWGAPCLQTFTAATTSTSRGEGANKDLKKSLHKLGLTLRREIFTVQP